jgi:hypothetical protein
MTINPKTFVMLAVIAFQHLHSQNSEYFVSINRSTGVHSRIDSVAGVLYVMETAEAIDAQNNRYYFLGKDAQSVQRLYGLNMTNGAVQIRRPISASHSLTMAYAYNDSTGHLYCLSVKQSPQAVYFCKVDTSTGTVSQIAQIPGAIGIVGDCSAIDLRNQRYFAQVAGTGGSSLITVSMSGSMVSSPASPNGQLVGLCYNNTTGKLYCFMKSGGSRSLVELDAASLSTTVIANYPTFINFYGDQVALNAFDTTITFNNTSFNKLTTVRLSDGVTKSSPTFPNGLAAGENVVNFRYNSMNGQLFGLHWGAHPAVANGMNEEVKEGVSFFPNPSDGELTIVFHVSTSAGIVEVIDALGRTIRKLEKADQQEMLLKDLPPGINAIKITADGKSVCRKVIVN